MHRWHHSAGKQPLSAMTRQHIIPRRKGGTNRRENIKLCCRACNQLLALVDDCPGAMACAFALGEGLGMGKGHSAARGAIRRSSGRNFVRAPEFRVTLADVWPMR
jgi:hypothetical protein